MSQELKIKYSENMVKYYNDECSVVFAISQPPNRTKRDICMSAISKLQEPEGFKNVPVLVSISEEKFIEMLKYLFPKVKPQLPIILKEVEGMKDLSCSMKGLALKYTCLFGNCHKVYADSLPELNANLQNHKCDCHEEFKPTFLNTV